jgi:ATP-dependent exoDNAse (exonuclease V) alpha subunit
MFMKNFNLPLEYNFIDLNHEFEIALDAILHTSDNLHIIGPAGVGKSTLIHLISDRRVLRGNTVVVAPTGVAAVNASSSGISSTTIHHLFKFPASNIYTKNMFHFKGGELQSLITSIDNLIMDEASMCNASLFDYMIYALKMYRARMPLAKQLPRLFIIGDPFQLPPVINEKDEVIKKFFLSQYNGNYMYFNSEFFDEHPPRLIELNKIYRQKDDSIQNILNRIRIGTQTQKDLDIINTRVVDEKSFYIEKELYVHLALSNEKVDIMNNSFLETLDGPPTTYQAVVDEGFDENIAKQLQRTVVVKPGYQVMVIKNSINGVKEYANGTLGKVVECFPAAVLIQTKENREIVIPRGDFEQIVYEKVVETPEKIIRDEQIYYIDRLVKGLDRGSFQTKEEYIFLGSVLKSLGYPWDDWYRLHQKQVYSELSDDTYKLITLLGKIWDTLSPIENAQEVLNKMVEPFPMKLRSNIEIKAKSGPKFNQILLKGAHALTVHKTQSLTLDALYFDLGSWIGMTSIVYVALSRAKTLEGIGLSRPITHKDIKVNKETTEYLRRTRVNAR